MSGGPLQRLGGYLHQDWPLEYDDVWDAVRAFKGDLATYELQEARSQAEGLSLARLDERELQAAIADLGIEYWPPGDGLTFQAWVERLVHVLDDPS